MPQESFILAPSQAAELAALRDSGRLVVVRSPALSEGDELALNSSALLLGRGSDNDVNLARDEFASSKHARVEPRRDGVWVEDVGSTNGTYLNGIRLTTAKRLAPGDVVRIGETELRYEA
jgi:pSer/pThr/pTyr-binding forkhead associated (FHA) protein